jgi:hypothetical protein
MANNLNRTSESFYDLVRADLAYIGVSISLPVTLSLDMYEYSFIKKENPLHRTIGMLENLLKFTKKKQQK